MSNIDLILRKARRYTVLQNLVDLLAYMIFASATMIIALSVSFWLLRSPWYGLLGIVPLLFYRPRALLTRAQELERKSGLKGEVVSSLQLSSISEDSKERYSRTLIQAFIENSSTRLRAMDIGKYVGFSECAKSVRFLLIAIIFALLQPAFFPGRFWYALHHKIEHTVVPGNAAYAKDAKKDITLHLNGVYVPQAVKLELSTKEETEVKKLKVQNGLASMNIMVSEPLMYRFHFLEHTTATYELLPLEPLYIEKLTFRVQYPAHTGLGEDVLSGRQLVVPAGTEVWIKGRASEPLEAVTWEFSDTIPFEREARDFNGRFTVRESGTAFLHLEAREELREPIRIYSIPDLAPLVDLFYPGANVNLPHGMKLDIGIRCSDDYGLSEGTFVYEYDQENTQSVALKRGAFEDTVYFVWDLSLLGMLPGDEVSYYVSIKDNGGQETKSNTYHVYFPTMEQMYEEVSEKETMLQTDMEKMVTQHGEHVEDIARIQEKLMKEREMSWADQEQLSEAISKEEEILEKVSDWQTELKKTIEKLNEGIILDQESIERLNEIARIMQEIAPEELRRALENLKRALEKRPRDIARTLEQVQKYQEELAKSLERSLEILKRFEEEEKLRRLAEQAEELAGLQGEIEDLSAADKDLADAQQQEVDQGIEELIDELNELSTSEGLEETIQEALKQMAAQTQNLKNASGKKKKSGLENLAMDLQQLYKQLTQGRFANLRENLLRSLQQIIETSKQQEELIKRDTADTDLQQEIIQTVEVIAESLFQQQTKSFFVSPQINKGLARATLRMKEAQQMQKNARLSRQKAAEAMKDLNLVARDILFSLRMMDQDGSSTGMSAFMQQMQNIADGQMMLSQSLMNMMPLPIQGLTPAQKQQLQRLGARQRELRQALESLRGEAASSKFQDMLGKVIDEMQDMEEALFQYKVDRELIERQKKVISRLLDSQRSIRREDYAKERQSKPGQDDFNRLRPSALTKELGKDELREMLQQELRKPYPKEYEIYIREYFKALLEEQ
jgi:hypothetical protein